MKRFMKVGRFCALLSAIELLFPSVTPMAPAAEPALPAIRDQREPARFALDVVTNATRELRGAVVNPNSTPSVHASVMLCQVSTKQTQQVTTDASGQFLFKDVRPGLYTVAVNSENGQTQQIARVWTPETAPPAATTVALVTLQQPPQDLQQKLQPGQQPPPQPPVEPPVVEDFGSPGFLGRLAGRPVLVTGLLLGTAAAIAIPVSVRHHGS
jgi:hypothetical protein